MSAPGWEQKELQILSLLGCRMRLSTQHSRTLGGQTCNSNIASVVLFLTSDLYKYMENELVTPQLWRKLIVKKKKECLGE